MRHSNGDIEDLWLVDLKQLVGLDPNDNKTKPSLSINLDASPKPKQERHYQTVIEDATKGGSAIMRNIAAARQSTSLTPPARALTDDEIGAWIWRSSRMAKLAHENNVE